MTISRREVIQRTLLAGAACAVVRPSFTFAAEAPATDPFTLPALPYALDALEPSIDARTMEIHHGKHHAAYVSNLNKAVSGVPELAGKSIEEILRRLDAVPESIRTTVRNNGGGHSNHSLFWQSMKKGGWRRAEGSAGQGDRRAVRQLRQAQGRADQGRPDGLRQRLGLADPRRRPAADRAVAEPGHAAQRRPDAAARHRRLGARLLPEVPEPPRRLRHGVLQRDRLGLRRQPLPAGEGVTASASSIGPAARAPVRAAAASRPRRTATPPPAARSRPRP